MNDATFVATIPQQLSEERYLEICLGKGGIQCLWIRFARVYKNFLAQHKSEPVALEHLYGHMAEALKITREQAAWLYDDLRKSNGIEAAPK